MLTKKQDNMILDIEKYVGDYFKNNSKVNIVDTYFLNKKISKYLKGDLSITDRVMSLKRLYRIDSMLDEMEDESKRTKINISDSIQYPVVISYKMLPDNYIILTKEFREIIKKFILSDDKNVEYRLIVLLNYVLDPYEKIISGICSDMSNLFSEIRSILDNENGKESSKWLKPSKEKEEARKVLINSMEAIENQMSECIDNICNSYPCKLNLLFKSVNEKIFKEDTDSIIESIITGYTDIINYYAITIGAISDTLSLPSLPSQNNL